jgi:MFS family permease
MQPVPAKKIVEAHSYNKKSVYVGLMSVLLIGAVVAQFGSTYAVHIRNAFPELAVSGVSILFAVNAFFVVIFSVPLGNALKEHNKVLMVGVGALLIGAGMAMLSISSFFMMAVLACLIYTTGEIIFFSMVQLVCYQGGKKNKKGRSLGMYRTTYALSRVVGPTAGGFIYLHFSGNVLWYLCGVAGCLCFAGCYLFKTSIS